MPRHLLLTALSTLLLASCTDSTDDDLDLIDDGDVIDEPGQPSISSDGEGVDAEVLAACSVTIAKKSELMITDLAVVEDPVRTTWTGGLATASDGAWHFGRLMTEMAGANPAEPFVRSWLNQWSAERTVNGQKVAARPISKVFDAWPKLAGGKLDLTKPPMRLLAIVNRFDLRSAGNAGEGRFVFGVLDATGNQTQFTIILEYKLPAANAAAVSTWANDWHALGALPLGSAQYRTKLQQITRKFAKRDAFAGRPNGSAISQVRTNEIALTGPWELREFHLTTTGQLRMATLAQTPAHDDLIDHNNTPLLADYMTQNAAAIKAQTHVVPATFEGQPFAAAHVHNNIDFWNAPGITDSLLRHRFSLNTCNGCHGAETNTFFLHVNPRNPGQEAPLSGFITGETVNDPITGAPRTFNDLQRRANGFKAFLCAP
ncbi:MAG: hypothetical protein ABI867_25485 [Kofleriaceae bacterium]